MLCRTVGSGEAVRVAQTLARLDPQDLRPTQDAARTTVVTA
jgi:hypothetical protein